MRYRIHEIFRTIQGEGRWAGTPAIFVRFQACNLWNGLESGRSKGAGDCAKWCDTTFVGQPAETGGTFSASELSDAIKRQQVNGHPNVIVLTGGEPSLQITAELMRVFAVEKFQIHIETNGTRATPGSNACWITLSPKKGGHIDPELVPDEIKLVASKAHMEPEFLAEIEGLAKRFRIDPLLQPVDGEPGAMTVMDVALFCMNNPGWTFCAQVHKMIGVP